MMFYIFIEYNNNMIIITCIDIKKIIKFIIQKVDVITGGAVFSIIIFFFFWGGGGGGPYFFAPGEHENVSRYHYLRYQF